MSILCYVLTQQLRGSPIHTLWVRYIMFIVRQFWQLIWILVPVLRQDINWTIAELLSIGPLVTNLGHLKKNSIILIPEYAFENIVCRMPAIPSRRHVLKSTKLAVTEAGAVGECWSHSEPIIPQGGGGGGILLPLYLIPKGNGCLAGASSSRNWVIGAMRGCQRYYLRQCWFFIIYTTILDSRCFQMAVLANIFYHLCRVGVSLFCYSWYLVYEWQHIMP